MSDVRMEKGLRPGPRAVVCGIVPNGVSWVSTGWRGISRMPADRDGGQSEKVFACVCQTMAGCLVATPSTAGGM